MTEQWRPVLGREGLYEVSDLGRVRSLNRTDHRGHRLAGRILKPKKAGRLGYRTVSLCWAGEVGPRYIHHLVLEAFVGPRPPGTQACHNFGDISDNRLINLRYDTPEENQRDRIAHGTDQFGERNARAKLTTADVQAIRASRDSQRVIATRYGVQQQAIHKIQTRQRWRHV